MSSDRKLSLSIAAVLLVLFTAVAVLSTGTGDRGSTATEARTRPPQATPAKFSPPEDALAVAPVSAPVATEVPVSAGTLEEAASFEVEPGVNYLARGIEAYQERNFGHAAAYLMAEVETRPERPYSHYLLALALWKDGRNDEAAEAMVRSVELDDTVAKSFVNLARIHNDRGDFDAALAAASRAVAIDPEDPSGHFLVGRSLHNQGRFEEAAEALRVSIEIDPENGFVWNMLGLNQIETEAFSEARESLERAVERQPGVAYIHNNLGMALERAGFRQEAALAYRRSVSLDAGAGRAAENLARLEPGGILSGPEEDGVRVAQELEPSTEEPGATP